MSDVATQHANGINGFKHCGLFIKPDYPFLAASPDGMFMCDCCSPAILEVKCPFSVEDEDINLESTYKRTDFLEGVRRAAKAETHSQVLYANASANVGYRH